MIVTVLRPFTFSRDGLTPLRADLGEADIPDGLVPGLAAEGFVAVPAEVADPDPERQVRRGRPRQQ